MASDVFKFMKKLLDSINIQTKQLFIFPILRVESYLSTNEYIFLKKRTANLSNRGFIKSLSDLCIHVILLLFMLFYMLSCFFIR